MLCSRHLVEEWDARFVLHETERRVLVEDIEARDREWKDGIIKSDTHAIVADCSRCEEERHG